MPDLLVKDHSEHACRGCYKHAGIKVEEQSRVLPEMGCGTWYEGMFFERLLEMITFNAVQAQSKS
jgi:hypothetical protein